MDTDHIKTLLRAVMTMIVFGGFLYMEWKSMRLPAMLANGTLDEAFKVPEGYVTIASSFVGYYLGQPDDTPVMDALLSFSLIIFTVAAYLHWGWLPEAINTQLPVVGGIYFARHIVPALKNGVTPVPTP